jgi:Mrp family chromosome partitioning ATPase/capsular polysaccharide biosynthesis protein
MPNASLDLRAYGAVLARRWTVMLPAVVLVPLVAALLALGQSKVYSANAQVLLTYSNPAAAATGAGAGYPATAPDRNVATQAVLARNPAVAREALQLSHARSTPTQLLAESNVSTLNSADVLNFTVNAPSPQEAMRLATNYATAYTLYRGGIDTQAVDAALAGVSARLEQLAKAGQTATPTYALLARQQQQLTAAAAAGTPDAVVVQPAQSAPQVSPHVARSAGIGLVLGIVLALALAFLVESLDRRASVAEITRRLGLPLLAAVPTVAGRGTALRRLAAVAKDRLSAIRGLAERHLGTEARATPAGSAERGPALASLAVLREPTGSTAAAFHALKSSLDVASLEHDFKSILLAGPDRFPEQAATAANLAVATAQAGRRVVLCDFHGRPPSVSDLFRLTSSDGLTEVALGETTLKRALVPVPTAALLSRIWKRRVTQRVAPDDTEQTRTSTVSRARGMPGTLQILPIGSPPPSPALLGSEAVARVIERLKSMAADLVIIDAPPLLGSGESQMLSALADAIIVAFGGPVRPPMLDELAVTLARLPTLPLGFITVGKGALGVGGTFGGWDGGRSATAGSVQTSTASPNGHRWQGPVRNANTTAP